MGYNVTQPAYGCPPDEEELQIAMIIQSKTEGGSCVRMQRLVPFDASSSRRNAIEVHPIMYLSSPLDDRKRDNMLSGYPVDPVPVP